MGRCEYCGARFYNYDGKDALLNHLKAMHPTQSGLGPNTVDEIGDVASISGTGVIIRHQTSIENEEVFLGVGSPVHSPIIQRRSSRSNNLAPKKVSFHTEVDVGEVETVTDNEDANVPISNNVEIGGGIDTVVNETVVGNENSKISTSNSVEFGNGEDAVVNETVVGGENINISTSNTNNIESVGTNNAVVDEAAVDVDNEDGNASTSNNIEIGGGIDMVVIETVVDNEDTNASTSNNVEIGGGIDAVVNEIVNVSTSIIGEIGGGINKEIEIEELIIPTIITDKVTDINFGKIYSTVLCSNCYSLEEQVDSLRGEVQLSVASWKCAAEENDKMKEYVLDLQRMQQEKDTTLLTKVKQQQKIEEEYKTLIRKMSQENSEKLEIAKNAMVSMKT